MTPKTIANYGGPFQDATPVVDPQTELSANQHNRALEDTAQLTRTAPKMWVSFICDAGAAPLVVAPGDITHETLWGTSVGTRPGVNKTADGVYNIQMPTPQVDSLGGSENIVFTFALASALTGDSDDDITVRITAVALNRIDLAVYSPAGVLADVGDISGNPVVVTVMSR